jgi:hypothetical protein
MFPDNIVRASFQQIETDYVPTEVKGRGLGGNVTTIMVMKAVKKNVDGMDALGKLAHTKGG